MIHTDIIILSTGSGVHTASYSVSTDSSFPAGKAVKA